ncbi:hypothetical protein HPB47_020633 [Ixodes persulcatus]|uniref:Uncharacterized protein n=1 Tax=Ixodes persulcatus TaxID=34615 RepID=A0AC60QFM9_IXOPE|nr:hypothetical protein HPB47_020633 [Ixodes persulcatus]
MTTGRPPATKRAKGRRKRASSNDATDVIAQRGLVTPQRRETQRRHGTTKAEADGYELSNVNASIEPLVPDGVVEQTYARTIEYDDKIFTYIATIAQEVEELRRARPQAGKTRIHMTATDTLQPLSLSNAEKFLYLRSALTGRTASTIAGIQTTGENYDTVVELLSDRFGRTDVLIQERLSQLLDLPAVRHSSEVSELRRLYDHLQRNMAALTALGVKSDINGAMLCSALLRMLPGEFIIDYHKCRRPTDKENDGIKIESLERFLKLEVESREEAQQVRQRAAKSVLLVLLLRHWVTLDGQDVGLKFHSTPELISADFREVNPGPMASPVGPHSVMRTCRSCRESAISTMSSE